MDDSSRERLRQQTLKQPLRTCPGGIGRGAAWTPRLKRRVSSPAGQRRFDARGVYPEPIDGVVSTSASADH
ncbi:MAG TPA: hypothetical protein VFR47_29780 [Anaerolineales bacterium]|nr:hypothetical protein [Anaerolineales bacterium]